MIKFLFPACLALFTCFSINAQKRFEIGIEGGLSKNFYQIKEPQNNLKNVRCLSGFGGANFRINTKKKFFVEMALLLTEYSVGIKLKQDMGYLTRNHDEVLLIPLRLGFPLPITKKFSFVPSVGITTSIKTLSQDGSVTINGEGNNRYEYRFRDPGKDLFFLANANALFEWKFLQKMKATAGICYYQGISQNSIADIRYKINNEPEQTGLLIGRGSFLGCTVGLKYLL